VASLSGQAVQAEIVSLVLVAAALVSAFGAPAQDPVAILKGRIELHDAMRAEPAPYDRVVKAWEESRETVLRLLDSDRLKNGREFHLASRAYADHPFFEPLRQVYELRLTAVLLNDAEARRSLPEAWDQLGVGMGTGQRFGTAMRRRFSGDGFEPMPSASILPPASIRSVWTGKHVSRSEQNEELTELARADQADRTNLSLRPEQLVERDRKRRRRALEILASGQAGTAADFWHAGLIFQHGEAPSDYALAHECAVSSAILGHTGAGGLCAVTYDRYLLSMGHRQRFGTQQGPSRRWTDSTGISASQRAIWQALPGL
jgi:hypothetical protein